MTVFDIEAKIKSIEEKLEKAKAISEKHYKRLSKRVSILNKFMEENKLSFTYDDVKEKDRWFNDYYGQSIFGELYRLTYDVTDVERSIQENQKKINEIESTLENWREKLKKEKAKNQYIQDSVPQEIKDFMLEWKNDVVSYTIRMAERYKEDTKKHKKEISQIYYDYLIENKEEFPDLYLGEYDEDIDYREYVRNSTKEAKSYIEWNAFNNTLIKVPHTRRYITAVEVFRQRYSDPLFRRYQSKNFDNDWLDSEVTEEMNKRLLDFMQKVSKFTGGTIIKADLHVSRGDINGIVYGEEGNAKVTTIEAEGPVQRWHLRVLVKKI